MSKHGHAEEACIESGRVWGRMVTMVGVRNAAVDLHRCLGGQRHIVGREARTSQSRASRNLMKHAVRRGHGSVLFPTQPSSTPSLPRRRRRRTPPVFNPFTHKRHLARRPAGHLTPTVQNPPSARTAIGCCPLYFHVEFDASRTQVECSTVLGNN
jgi:hypothetical protein